MQSNNMIQTPRYGTPKSGRVAATALCLAGLSASALLSGCAMGNGGNMSPAPTPVPGVALHGQLFGGQQPVSGSTIQLYAAGQTGYGSAATPLIGGTNTTDSRGNFNITGAYTCPTSTTQVYITASGGNAGSGNNANLKMMAALGPCGNLSSSTFIFINEITTVGSVWALAPFMLGPANLGTSSTNLTGLVNAFADVNTLVNTTTGNVSGPATPAGTTLPVAEINTLADILASCVNSSGGSAHDGSPCGNLFSAATPTGFPAATDTVIAAMYIAQNPSHNMSSLYALASPTAPFQPTLASQPSDFTIAVTYSNAAFSTPSGLAADSQGNVWVTNSAGNSISKLSHTGAVAQTITGLNAPSALAIDASDGVWITNKGNNTLTHFNSAGTAAGGSPYSGGGLNQPTALSLDYAGNVWISNAGNSSVSEFSSTGTAISGASGFTPAGLSTPIGIVVSPH